MALPRYQFTVQDEAGNIVSGASVRVTSEVDGSLSTLYLDELAASPAGNPVYSDAEGFVYFHVVAGTYKIVITWGGGTRTYRYVGLGTAVTDGVTPGVKLTFDSLTTNVDPGNGKFRQNNATFASVTALYVDNVDSDGNATTAILDSWDDTGTSSNRGTLELRSVTTPSTFAIYTVTGSVVDSTGYRTISVTPVANTGTLSGIIAFSFTRTGSAGTNGTNGITPSALVTFDSATSGDPGAGKFGFNNATLASVTAIRVDNTDSAGADITATLDSFDDSGNTSDRGLIEFRSVSDASKFFLGKVTGSVADSTGYRTFSVTYINSSGPLSGNCSMTFSRTGNTGASGAGSGDVVGPAGSVANRLATFGDTTGKLLADGGAVLSTDGTFASNSDAKVPTEKAVKTYVDGASPALSLMQGRLDYVSTTLIRLNRYNGRSLFINGTIQTIPSAGVDLANTGLTASTLYYIYAYMVSTTVTLEGSTTAPAVDSTYGHKIKTGDATRTLVGQVYMDAGTPGTFADTATKRWVVSYYNRINATVTVNSGSLYTTTVAAGSWTSGEISSALRTSFLHWGDEDLLCATTVMIYHASANVGVYVRIGFGVAIGTYATGSTCAFFGVSAGANYYSDVSTAGGYTPVAGLNTATLQGGRDSGTGNYASGYTGYTIIIKK